MTAAAEHQNEPEGRAGAMLAEKGWKLAVAESCTGGRLAHRITAVPGSSSYFLGGVTAYADSVKTGWLGVDPRLLERDGAVSESVARAMAEGVRVRMGADIALSTTGIAGPGGGTVEKPVGLVFTALAGPGGSIARKHLFAGNRNAVRESSASAALGMLEEYLEKAKDKPGAVRGGSTHG